MRPSVMTVKRILQYISVSHLIIGAICCYILAACASIGHPTGGPEDEVPPVFVRANPAIGALNVSNNRIIVQFDENVQIKDALNTVVVSPAQKTFPKVSAVGRSVRIDLADTLQPNTTYTIDFTDGISDLNEGNELDGFAVYFSTGDYIDSLCISGMVLEAETLEPAQGMTVGVYSNLSDTAITTLPFERVTRTNKLGQFTIRNLAPGEYHIFAVDDKNRDNHWDRSENIAFWPTPITPTAKVVSEPDTLKDADGQDSIVMRNVTHFYPDDVLLTWFNVNYKAQYLSKYERPERYRLHFEMGAPATELPRIAIVGSEFDGRDLSELALIEASAKLDTLDYWITDSALYSRDSLSIAMTYLRTDTLEQLSYTTDTLRMNIRPSKTKKKKTRTKDNADTTANDTAKVAPPPIPAMKVSAGGSTLDVYSPLTLKFEKPLLRGPDSSVVKLAIKVDTLWEEIDPPVFATADSLHHLVYTAEYEWEPGAQYQLTIDSLMLEDIYGAHNDPFTSIFSVRDLSEYSTLTFNISGVDSSAFVVQLLSEQDKPVRTESGRGDGQILIPYISPGNYYARLFIDRNDNGKFDAGSLADTLMPEDMYYYPKRMQLRKNWAVEQAWDINETPVDLQKPNEIKKNKPKKKKGEQDNPYGDEDDDQYYDEFGNPAVDPDDPFGKRRNQRDSNLNNRGGRGNAGYRNPNGMLR